MRRVRYSVAVSLDGYTAGPNGEADWIVVDPEIDFTAMARDFDTVLMGRRTFQAATAMAGGGGPFGAMKIVVVSRTLESGDQQGITVVSPPIGDAVAALKQERHGHRRSAMPWRPSSRNGTDIWLFRGGQLCRSLLDLDLVDAIEVAVIPVVLGAGIR